MPRVYDRMMAKTEAACLADWRAGVLADLDGEVLEIGAGTGHNLAHYTGAVARLVLSEPDPAMRVRLERRLAVDGVRAPLVEVLDAAADRLPFADASFDAVVSTLVLCSVPDQPATLAEIRRVLRPGGRLAYIEHVAATDRPDRERLQRRIEPVWRLFAGGCRLTRATGDAIVAAGFEPGAVTRESMRRTVPWVRPSVRGVARRGNA